MDRKNSSKTFNMDRSEDSNKNSIDATNVEDSEENSYHETSKITTDQASEVDSDSKLQKSSEELDNFLHSLSESHDYQIPPDVPESFDEFTNFVEEEVANYESLKDPGVWCQDGGESGFLDRVSKLSRLASALAGCRGESKYALPLDRSSSVLQRVMVFLEEEFGSLLEKDKSIGDPDSAGMNTPSKTKKQASFSSNADQNSTEDPSKHAEFSFQTYSPEILLRLSKIVDVMTSAGYETECCQIYCISRRNHFVENLSKIGFENVSIEDVQKMAWDALESEISKWTRACKHCVTVYFPGEKKTFDEIFVGRTMVSGTILGNFARAAVIQLINFAEASAMTKRSSEKLFKFLEMYEGLCDLIRALDEIFSEDASSDLKTEISTVRSRLGEAAVGMFSDLENSVKSDHVKTPVPGGAVHPLTRYVMNYLKYVCDFKDTMEQIFQEHRNPANAVDSPKPDGPIPTSPVSSFALQLVAIMDLLDANLAFKSKLYKDPSLSYIFLMNNGRYIMQRIKGSPEIQSLLGDTRKRSSVLRQYHKNYTRETWGKLLACLKDDGLMQAKGNINKPMLKERFKSFNALFEEIHKTQSCWVVSDEQLQSELRVSISAVVVPAYRSFLGRFQQYLDTGRQTEKYVKFGPEELETFIDDLFDGTPSSMARRRS